MTHSEISLNACEISLNDIRLYFLLDTEDKYVTLPFICRLHPVISKISMAQFRMINLNQLVNITNNLVQQPSSDTPPTTETEDSDPLFSRGFFYCCCYHDC